MKTLDLFNRFGIILNILKKSAIYITIPVFFLYILLDKPDYKVISAIQKPVVTIAVPLGQAVTWPIRAMGNFIAKIAEYNGIAEDNEKLRRILDSKIQIENEHKFLIAEVDRLKKLLGIQKDSKYPVIWGEIIVNLRSLGNNFIINIGASSGVYMGDIVLSERGNVLGFITSVTNEYSKVRKLNDINSNIIVKVSGTEIFGFLQGSGTANPYFEYYSDPDFKPKIGTQIVSSSLNSLMPDNIPIGEISRIISKSRATVKLYDEAHRVKTVRVISTAPRAKMAEVLD
ncbi:MAG: rod shape-determining protein MreC [Alphaproteobacteria bacterium]|nr:rod shape-determining protein MreC [Alphaproteobacteria bacterium]